MMKRLSSAIIVLLAFTAAWADSPLTSTYFAGAYEDHPMVQLIDEDLDGDIPSVVLEFLALFKHGDSFPRQNFPGVFACIRKRVIGSEKHKSASTRRPY